ncbi:MAG: uracil-DNA glycosylase [Candidatus Micrarchaeota archaeon]|nr:uracil-DNA glycosylase [Candidatus Micrarchaeota archaeon]
MDKAREITRLNAAYGKLPRTAGRWLLSRRFVPAEGPPDAEVMFIGQAPGRNEDMQLRPFIGTSGKFLDRLMGLAGIERKSAYIASVVQFFPPENRIPSDEEIQLCSRFLFRQIDIVNPRFVILLGSVACKTVLGMEKIGSIHGTVVKKGNRTYMLSMHPAAAVRIRSKMPEMERDFRRFRKIMSRK